MTASDVPEAVFKRDLIYKVDMKSRFASQIRPRAGMLKLFKV